MREIKFRCWNKERKEMVYGVDLYADGGAFEGTNDNPYDFDRETLGQYTGLKDKNGKEIYEGDILQVSTQLRSYEKNYMAELTVPYANYVVIWDDKALCWSAPLAFAMDSFKYRLASIHNIEACKIVGNIYENKELLTK